MRISDWSSDVCSSDLDEVDAADMRVEVDADARPFQPRGDLLDMRRLAGAVIALHHDAAVELEAREDGERRVAVEDIGRVEVGYALVGLAERRDRKSTRLNSSH